MMRRRSDRRGYALMLVVVFCAIFTALLAVAWRQMESAMRTFSLRTNQILRDQGAVQALANAVHALEVGPPPDDPGDSYVCYDTVTIYPVQQLRLQSSAATSQRHYRITFTRKPGEESGGNRVYVVEVAAVESPSAPALDINNFGADGP